MSVADGYHKALFLLSKGGSSEVRRVKTPRPESGQLLVKTEAVGLNPADWKMQKYGLFIEVYPTILGLDIAGVVEDIGEDVTNFVKGDKVFYQRSVVEVKDIRGAAFQQYNTVHAETAAKIPSNLSFEEAATLPTPIGAALTGLYAAKPYGAGLTLPFAIHNRRKNSGQPLLVLGGATSVGQYVIQFGKLSGFSPIITTASLKHDAFLRSLGATHVIDRHTPIDALRSEVKQITAAPFEIVFDAVSLPDTQQAGYDILADGGLMVIVFSPEIKLADGKALISVLGLWSFPHIPQQGATLQQRLPELLEEGVLLPLRVEVIPGGIDGIVEGLERLAEDKVSGVKLVVRPQEAI